MPKDAVIEGPNVPQRVFLADKPDKASNDRDAVPVADLLRILDAASRRDDGARWVVGIFTGARQGEVLGLEWDRKRFFEIDVPGLVIPVAPGRNLSVLVEVACRVFLLKTYGLRPWGNPGGLLQPGDVFPLDNGGEP